MKYLADTSALVRILRRQVDPVWHEHVSRGLIAICEPVLTEAMKVAEARRYSRVENELRATYPWVHVPESVWDITASMRRELAKCSAHNGPSVTDYVVAAAAIQHKLVVLHEDADFETIRRVVPQVRERRVSGAFDDGGLA